MQLKLQAEESRPVPIQLREKARRAQREIHGQRTQGSRSRGDSSLRFFASCHNSYDPHRAKIRENSASKENKSQARKRLVSVKKYLVGKEGFEPSTSCSRSCSCGSVKRFSPGLRRPLPFHHGMDI